MSVSAFTADITCNLDSSQLSPVSGSGSWQLHLRLTRIGAAAVMSLYNASSLPS